MTYPQKTYELAIHVNGAPHRNVALLKEAVKNELQNLQIDSFVEGIVDGLDIDVDHEAGPLELDLPDDSPIIIYKYDKESLRDVERKLKDVFSNSIRTKVSSFQTQSWLDGWKDSFKPFQTQKFVVRPPWEKSPPETNRIDLIVEPGMAFGTGQHATTKLCIEEIETIDRSLIAKAKILDVGCGTGILAIALAKLGAKDIIATDIDDDAMLATKHNQELNGCEFPTSLESIPQGPYDIIVGNILTVILKRLMPDLVAQLNAEGKLILSGVLVEEEAELIEFCKPYGLCLSKVSHQDDWTCIVLEKVEMQ